MPIYYIYTKYVINYVEPSGAAFRCKNYAVRRSIAVHSWRRWVILVMTMSERTTDSIPHARKVGVVPNALTYAHEIIRIVTYILSEWCDTLSV